MTRHTSLLVTPREAVSVLRALEPRAVRALDSLTPARLRYLELYGVSPTVPGSGTLGAPRSRLYSVDDVAVLRLWVRLSAEIGPMAARFTLAYHGPAIREAIAARRPVVVAVRGKAAALVPPRVVEGMGATAAIPVSELVAGVEAAMQRVRDASPEVWAGRDWLTPEDAIEEYVTA